MTTVPIAPLAVQEIAVEVLDVAKAALTAAGVPPARAVVTIGTEPWDDCCEGLLVVQIARWFPLAAIFEQQSGPSPCPVGFALQLDVVHAMCAPVGAPPAATSVLTATWAITEAGWRITAAVQGLVNGWAKVHERAAVLGDWLPIGPEGGCQGGRLAMTIEMTSGLITP